MSCESSIADLTMDMFEDEPECKDQLLSHIKELNEAVTLMKSAFTDAQKQLEGVQGDDGKLKEELETTKNQCQQQSSEILRLILSVQTELGTVKEMVKSTQLLQHGLQSTIQSLLLDRDFLLDELTKTGAISDSVRGRLHTHLNGYVVAVGRPSSGSQSTNDSGVAFLGENGSNKSTTVGNSQNNHVMLSASNSNDNLNPSQNHQLHHHHLNGLGGSTSPAPGVAYPGVGLGPNGDAISVAEHHLLNHHHNMHSHVQEYLNSHSHHHHQQQQHLRCMCNPQQGELLPTASTSSVSGPPNITSMTMMQGCCCSTVPPPPPLTYAPEIGSPGVVYDSDSSLTLAASKSLSLSNSLSKQCGLELDQQQLIDAENKKKGRRSSHGSTSSNGKCTSGRTCDVTSGTEGGRTGRDPSCYNSDAELVLTDDGLKAGQNSSGNSTAMSMMSFKENQRLKVAKELLDTERKYCHTLKTIQDTFALPLKTSGILSMKDINTLFPEEVFKLYEKHCDLLSQLEERVTSWKNQSTVGDLLERFINGEDANVLRLYTSYVNDFPEVLKTFHKLCRSCTDFTRFLKSTLDHPACGGLDLGAFLLTPVQRMPRYILLLKQMMKFTDGGHPDHGSISICLDRLREYLKRLNDSMEHSFQLVTAQISPQPHEPLLEKLMGFSGKNYFPRASTSSQSSTGGEPDHEQVVHRVRYKRSTSVPRSSHSSTSETGGPKSMPPACVGNQKEGKSKLKNRSKSDWTVCHNNTHGSKASMTQTHEDGNNRCISCNCASAGNVQAFQQNKVHGTEGNGKHHSRFKGKKNVLERTLSDSDINSDGDDGSLEEKETSRKFSTSKSLHDFNQEDDDIDAGNLEWFISEPSLCEIKHGNGAHHRHDAVGTPEEEDVSLTRNSSLRRNVMIRPMTTHPSGRVVARLTRASESEMNLHTLEAGCDKETRAPKNKSKMSLRTSLKNIFSIKKRGKNALQISHPIPPTLCENGSTIYTCPPGTNFCSNPLLEHQLQLQHHLEHQSMPDPTILLHSSCRNNPERASPIPRDSCTAEQLPPTSLPCVPSSSSATSITSNNSSTAGHHRYVKNKLAQPKFPRTPFVKKHSSHTISSGGVDFHDI